MSSMLGAKQYDRPRGERDSRLVEECCDLLALPGNGVAFWIVFIVGADIARGFHDVIEAAHETRGAPYGRRAQFVQLGAGIA